MKALGKLRECLQTDDAASKVRVSYESDDGEGPYYKIAMSGTIPFPEGETLDTTYGTEANVRKRMAFGNALQLKLVDFVFGERQRSNASLVELLDLSSGDYSQYRFEFHLPAEEVEKTENIRRLQGRTSEEGSRFHAPETLLKWMETQERRDAAASRKIFRPTDGGDFPDF